MENAGSKSSRKVITLLLRIPFCMMTTQKRLKRGSKKLEDLSFVAITNTSNMSASWRMRDVNSTLQPHISPL
jgi:hypothetical protein